jgi:hypothetical protein
MMIDEESGEILVERDEARRCISLHFKGTGLEEYGIVRLNRQEARRLAALILLQAEGMGETRLVRQTA